MKKLRNLSLLLLLLFAGFACTKSIPGNPEKVMEEYVKAVQKGDFDTIYRLNRITARQKNLIDSSESLTKEDEIKRHMQQHKNDYDSMEPGLFTGAQWSEKHFFPASSTVTVGKATEPPAVEGDPVNAEYEKAITVYLPVNVVYNEKADAPAYGEKNIRTVKYDCTLTKIRRTDSVRVYSHDEAWYFARCIFDPPSATYFE